MNIKKFIYKYILKRKYYRTGQCNRCGDCCSKIYVYHKKGIIKSEDEFLSLKNLHPFYTYLEITDKDENGLVFKCSKFDKENHNCTIHKLRPGICRRYPSEILLKMHGVMSEKCGYKFIPIDSFKDVLNKLNKTKKYQKNNLDE